jgi:NAD(P)H dehydrogenase (quinone)
MQKIKVLVLFYTSTGNTAKLAKFIAEGASSVEETDVEVKQVPGSKAEGIPVATQDDFVSADALVVGTPTHFGSFAAEIKAFLGGLTPVWLKGQVAGKPVAFFCSAGSMHGGEEATLISLMIPFFNLVMQAMI